MRAILIIAISLLFQWITAIPQQNPDNFLMPPPVPRPINQYQNEPQAAFPYSMMQKIAGWFGYGDNKNRNTQKNPNLENEPQYPQNRLITTSTIPITTQSQRLPKQNQEGQLKTDNRGYREAIITENVRPPPKNCNPCNKDPWVPMFQTPQENYPIKVTQNSENLQTQKLRAVELVDPTLVENFDVSNKGYGYNKPQDSYMPQYNQHRPNTDFRRPLVTTQDSYMPHRHISTIVGTGDYAIPPYRLPIQNDRFLAPIPIPNLSATPIPPLHDAISFLKNPYKNQIGPQPEYEESHQQNSNKIVRETVPNSVMMPPPLPQEFPLYHRPSKLIPQQQSRTPSNVNIPSININNSFNQNIRQQQLPAYRKSPEENLHFSNLAQLGMKPSDFEIVRSIAVAQFTQSLNYPTKVVDVNLANFALKEATKSILAAVTERYKTKQIIDDDSYTSASSHNITVELDKTKKQNSRFNFVTTRNPIEEETETEDFSIETTTDYFIDARFQNRKEDLIKEEYDYDNEKSKRQNYAAKRQQIKDYVTEKINFVEYATQTPYLQEYKTERYEEEVKEETRQPTTIQENYPTEKSRVEEIEEIQTIKPTSPRSRSQDNFKIPRYNEQKYPEQQVTTDKPIIQEFISEQQRIEQIREVPIIFKEQHRIPLFNQQLTKIQGNYPQKSRLQEYSPQKTYSSEIPNRKSKPIRQTQTVSLQQSSKKERDTPLNLLDTPIHYFQSTKTSDDLKPTQPTIDYSPWTPSTVFSSSSTTTQSTPIWNPSTQSPSSFTTNFYIKKIEGTQRPKQIQIIIPYTTKNRPMPFEKNEKAIKFTKSNGWTSQSHSIEEHDEQESKVVTATQAPIRKTTAKYLTKILASSIRDLLKKEKQNLTTEMPKRESYLSTLQSTIDEWTEKQFSSPSKASTISLHFRPKQIPEEYLTTTLSYDETTAASPTTYEPLYADQPIEEVNRNTVEFSNHRREKSSSSTLDLWKKLGVSISPLTNEKVIVVTPQPAWMEFRKINNFNSPRFVIRPTPGSLINPEKNPAVVYGESLAESG